MHGPGGLVIGTAGEMVETVAKVALTEAGMDDEDA